jgi:glycerol-3-phosphate dehydrogenase
MTINLGYTQMMIDSVEKGGAVKNLIALAAEYQMCRVWRQY